MAVRGAIFSRGSLVRQNILWADQPIKILDPYGPHAASSMYHRVVCALPADASAAVTPSLPSPPLPVPSSSPLPSCLGRCHVDGISKEAEHSGTRGHLHTRRLHSGVAQTATQLGAADPRTSSATRWLTAATQRWDGSRLLTLAADPRASRAARWLCDSLWKPIPARAPRAPTELGTPSTSPSPCTLR